MKNYYDDKYGGEEYYWGMRTSSTCLNILKCMPPVKSYKLLDIGCGEGQNAIFFARNGYDLTGFDLAGQGLDKARRLAEKAGVKLSLFHADINEFRLDEEYDILFSSGVLHYVSEELKKEIFDNYKRYTTPNGIHMFSVLIEKPFIPPSPEREETARLWKTGELFTYYHDWKVELCVDEIFDCQSSGIPHKHAENRILARKV